MRIVMSWIKRVYAPILIISLSCLMGVAVVEVALRILNSNDPWPLITSEANILRNFQFSYDISQTYKNDAPSVDYVRNQYGLRDTCESPAEIEILTIGGSTTDQRYVALSSTYQNIIEERMKMSSDAFGCVSNAGVDGHSTWGHLYSFENWFPLIPGLNPKIILLYVGVNDANFLRASSPNTGYDTKHTDAIKTFLKRFEIVRALLPIYRLMKQQSYSAFDVYAGHPATLFTDDDYTVNVMNEQTELLSNQNAFAFRSRMENLLSEIQSLGASPLCVTQPHIYVKEIDGEMRGLENVLGRGFSGIDYDYSIRKLNEVIFDLCGSNTVDLYSHEFSNSHFYDGVHTTAKGSEEIGRVIADFIISSFN
jgi:lysophospholipase L1-like esterase